MKGIYEGLYCVTGGKKYKFGVLFKHFFDMFKVLKDTPNIDIDNELTYDNVNNTTSYSISVGRTFSGDCKELNDNTLAVIYILSGIYHRQERLFSFDREAMTRLAFLMESCETSDNVKSLFRSDHYKEEILLNRAFVYNDGDLLYKAITCSPLYTSLPYYHPILFNSYICGYSEHFHINVLYWFEETDREEHTMQSKALRIEIKIEDVIDFRTGKIDPYNQVKQLFEQLITAKINNKVINKTKLELRWRPTEEMIGSYIFNTLNEYISTLKEVIVHNKNSSYHINRTNFELLKFQQNIGYEIKEITGEL